MCVICVDLHGTITKAPDLMRELLGTLRAAGWEVHVLTGEPDDSAKAEHIEKDMAILSELGLGDCYDQIAVVANPKNHVAKLKVQYMKRVGAVLLIDNLKENCKAAKKAGFAAFRIEAPHGAPQAAH